MLFTSATFVFFHLIVLALRWTLPRQLVGPLLLLSSYAFYLSWGPRYGLLIGGMTAAGWVAGLAMDRYRRVRRPILALVVTAVLVTLAVFKYASFLGAQASALLQLFGATKGLPRVDIVLPLAISFYSFEVISYVVDVYRGEAPERSPVRFALYVAYYPHLIAGPIVRAHELLPQLRAPVRFDGNLVSAGVSLALVGYVKKMVLADNLAVFADQVFANPGQHSAFGLFIGALAYSGQIYCDFSGYTDITRGVSQTLGYPLPENFAYPYLATSITDFWRRWHMTLSRWLRDYLYIPLGGSRGSEAARYRNLFLTMLLGGLWHGASWTFVAWGAFHGALLALHKLWDGLPLWRGPAGRVRAGRPYAVAAWAVTFGLVTLAWIFFRAPTFTVGAEVVGRIARGAPGVGAWSSVAAWPAAMRTACAVLPIVAILHVLGHLRVGVRIDARLPPAARGVVWAVLLVVCFFFSESRAQFIYFQF